MSVSIFPFVALDTSARHLAVESRNKVTIAVFHAINWKFDVTDHEDTVVVKRVEPDRILQSLEPEKMLLEGNVL